MGSGHAGTNWGISQIQRVTGYMHLENGTLNVKLEAEHILRPFCTLRREDREDRINEDLSFERCCLLICDRKVPALIARTSTNHWGSCVLEIMAEEKIRQCYGLEDGDTLEVEVCVENVPEDCHDSAIT